MKKYVSYFGPNPEKESARSQFEDHEPYRVQYSSGPEWKTHYTEAHFCCNELRHRLFVAPGGQRLKIDDGNLHGLIRISTNFLLRDDSVLR
jgi:hypothetical protein